MINKRSDKTDSSTLPQPKVIFLITEISFPVEKERRDKYQRDIRTLAVYVVWSNIFEEVVHLYSDSTYGNFFYFGGFTCISAWKLLLAFCIGVTQGNAQGTLSAMDETQASTCHT